MKGKKVVPSFTLLNWRPEQVLIDDFMDQRIVKNKFNCNAVLILTFASLIKLLTQQY